MNGRTSERTDGTTPMNGISSGDASPARRVAGIAVNLVPGAYATQYALGTDQLVHGLTYLAIVALLIAAAA